jgi:predicted protein tyrosine phosphatase
MYVIRPWLYLGNYKETFNLELLQLHGIKAMLQFAEPVEQAAIPFLYLALEDGNPLPPGMLQKGIEFIYHHHQNENKVMVSCGAGISRSVSFIIAALKEIDNIPLIEAYQSVLIVHPGALPHLALWYSLCN